MLSSLKLSGWYSPFNRISKATYTMKMAIDMIVRKIAHISMYLDKISHAFKQIKAAKRDASKAMTCISAIHNVA
eukprot:scaffold30085_cov19-Prasinocladus_malaysianus.AAC.1